MRPIRFRFNSEKLVQALALLAARGATGLDTMKAVKLLYFADRQHLLRYGRPITGDQYYCMKNGPIPSVALSQIQDVLALNPSGDHDALFDEYFDVDRTVKYPQLVAKREPDLEALSASDVEVLEDVANTYGGKTAWQLRDLTHRDECVAMADEELRKRSSGSVPIPFQAFFLGSDSKLLPLVETDQENRDFSESLTW